MRRTILLLAALLVSAGAAAAQSVAFTDVTVIDVAEGVAEGVAEPGRTVLVTGDRIVAVGKAGEMEVPSDASATCTTA